MSRLPRLPVLLYWLLCLSGGGVSACATWARWLGSLNPTESSLRRSADLSRRIGLPAAPTLVALADLVPAEDARYLRAALEDDPRHLPALLRLSLHAEFAGDPARAQLLIDEAVKYHHTYKAYVAAASHAARQHDSHRLTTFASLALLYCPRDADDIFTLAGPLANAEGMLANAAPPRRIDYLRFLIGQSRFEEAAAFESRLPKTDRTDSLRVELSEHYLLAGNANLAGRLFTGAHPDFRGAPYFNVRLESKPTGLGFDWRCTQDPKARVEWRPGALDIQVDRLDSPLELLSIFGRTGTGESSRRQPVWESDSKDLFWRTAPAAAGFQRGALVAQPGPPRRIHFEGFKE